MHAESYYSTEDNSEAHFNYNGDYSGKVTITTGDVNSPAQTISIDAAALFAFVAGAVVADRIRRLEQAEPHEVLFDHPGEGQ